MNSRRKGCRGERDAASAWAQALGGFARRGQQFAGGTDSPDVITSYDGIHLEVKRVEAGNPYHWVEQACRDSGGKVPVVLHRRNRQEWLAIVRLADVPRLAAEINQTFQAVGKWEIPPPVPGADHGDPGEQDGGGDGVFRPVG
jgi:hypothetical protein